MRMGEGISTQRFKHTLRGDILQAQTPAFEDDKLLEIRELVCRNQVLDQRAHDVADGNVRFLNALGIARGNIQQ